MMQSVETIAGQGSLIVALPVTSDDMRFFLAHPGRDFRIRLASAGEISHTEFRGISYPATAKPGVFLHAFVGRRCVTLIAPFEYLQGEASEDQARNIWTALYQIWLDEYRAGQASIAARSRDREQHRP